jgi:guanylate kinase
MIIVISGPSGVGKGSIAKKLIEKDRNIKIVITCTTRDKRVNEIEGRDYYFFTEIDFLKKIDKGEFAEYSIVHGKRYGVLKKSIEKGFSNEADILLQIDVQGAKKIKNQYDEALLIFIMPPNIDVLFKRLEGRGTETREEEENRIKRAREEIEERYFYDFVILNDELERAVDEIYNIILSERTKRFKAYK